MGHSGCVALTDAVTTELDAPTMRAEAASALRSGANDETLVALLAASMDPSDARLLREELVELPATLVRTIVSAWELAEAGGREFVLTSLRPDRPLEFARAERVRVSMDLESDRVLVALSHIPGRHAAWYRPASVAV